MMPVANDRQQAGPPVFFSNHAIDRLIQRFPEIASDGDLQAAFRRAVPLSIQRLRAEARYCGRPIRVVSSDVLFRDETTGCLFVCGKDDGGRLVVKTVVPFRVPKGFQWLQ